MRPSDGRNAPEPSESRTTSELEVIRAITWDFIGHSLLYFRAFAVYRTKVSLLAESVWTQYLMKYQTIPIHSWRA